MHYTTEMLRYLKRNKLLPRAKLTERFNKNFKTQQKVEAIDSTCARNGWFTGRTGCFMKRQKPWNIGTKGVCKPNSGCFRKGNISRNRKPVGSERIDSQYGYILVKVAEPQTWRAKHLIVWESAHGKLQKGEIVRFKDNNKLNCALDNLEKVNRRLHLHLNRIEYAELPIELKPTAKACAELEVKIFERLKKEAIK